MLPKKASLMRNHSSNAGTMSTSQDPISTSIQSIRSESVFEEPLNQGDYVNQSNLGSPDVKQ